MLCCEKDAAKFTLTDDLSRMEVFSVSREELEAFCLVKGCNPQKSEEPELVALLKEMALSSGLRHPSLLMRTVSVTYEKVTPESAADGDFSDAGFEVEPELMDLDEISKTVFDYGIYSPVSSFLSDGLSSSSSTDWKTGEETTYTLHVRDESGRKLSEDEMLDMCKALDMAFAKEPGKVCGM